MITKSDTLAVITDFGLVNRNDEAIVSPVVGYICNFSCSGGITKLLYRTTNYTVDTRVGLELLLRAILAHAKLESHSDAVDSFRKTINTKVNYKVVALLNYIQDTICKSDEYNLTITSEFNRKKLTTFLEWKDQSASHIIKLTNTGELVSNIAKYNLSVDEINKIVRNYYSGMNSTIKKLLQVVSRHIDYADSKSDDLQATTYQYLDFRSIVEVLKTDRSSEKSMLLDEALNLPDTELYNLTFCEYPDEIDIRIQIPQYENKCSQMLFREVLCREFNAKRYTTKKIDQDYVSRYGESKRLYQVKALVDNEYYLFTYRVDFHTNSDFDAQHKVIMLNITKGQPEIMDNYRPLEDYESNTRY